MKVADMEVRQTVRSAAEAGIEKPAGVPASVFALADSGEPLGAYIRDLLLDRADDLLRRELAAAVCRSLAREHNLTTQDLEAA